MRIEKIIDQSKRDTVRGQVDRLIALDSELESEKDKHETRTKRIENDRERQLQYLAITLGEDPDYWLELADRINFDERSIEGIDSLNEA